MNTTDNLEHALLYSIGVNLPAHRVGQLDRVLVLASPINDINLHAWDLNRVQRFLQLDIGIRVELCTKCLRSKQEKSITFIMERMFITDCVKFLCKEARIDETPTEDGGFVVYNVPHKCFYTTPPTDKAPPPPPPPLDETLPPPYSENVPPPIMPKGMPAVEHDYDVAEYVETALPSRSTLPSKRSSVINAKPSFFKKSDITTSAPSLHSNPASGTNPDPPKKPLRPIFQFPDEVWEDYSSGSGSGGKPPPIRSSSFTESLFLADGILTQTTTTTQTFPDLPPRTIPRKNHGTSIPATTHLYANFQPHLFNNSAGKYSTETPYQISSRIIITDNGDVQYERNVLGNTPVKMTGGLHFRKTVPLPPRSSKADRKTGLMGSSSSIKTEGVVSDFRTEADVHNGSISISTTLTSATKSDQRTSSDSPRPPNQVWDHYSTTTEPLVMNSPPHASNSSTSNGGKAGTELDSKKADGTNSSLVTTVFSTKVTPQFPPTPTSPDFSKRKLHGSRPLPPLLSRTSSYSKGSVTSKDRGQKRPSFAHSTSYASQTSVDSYEDDCYVIVRPLTRSLKSPTPSSPEISPSYVQEEELLQCIAERSKYNPTSVVTKDNKDGSDEVFEDSNSRGSQLSLADAGDVIRQDWIASLDALRLERKVSASEPQLEVAEDRIDLEEVALTEYKKTLRCSKFLSGSDYVDDIMLLTSNSSPATPPRLSTQLEHEGLRWQTDSSSSSEMEGAFNEGMTSSPERTNHTHLAGSHGEYAESASPGGGVADQLGDNNTSRGVRRIKKPTIRPRKKNISMVVVSDSSSTPKATGSTPGRQSYSSSRKFLESEEQENIHYRDYVENSVPLPGKHRPIPVPRKTNTLGVKLSAAASMVTMGIGHMSSSEGDLLDAVFKDSLSPGEWSGGRSLHHKFYSSTEIYSQYV